MRDPTQRFATRVENYIKYRPGYPRQVLGILGEECALSPDWHVADVGSGTGLLTELFLGNGNLTYGVEPNDEMRRAAEALLKSYTNFTSVKGSAENTTLSDSSVEMVAAGQAFHWFNRELAKREFARILKPGGWVALIWNERRVDTPFLEAYERLLKEFSTDYDMVDHRNVTLDVLASFFSPSGHRLRSCENYQTLDFEGVKGRLLSSSYVPEPGDPRCKPMIEEVVRIFERHQDDGKVVFEYDTRVFIGRLD